MKKVALFWFSGILAIGILMSCSDDSSGGGPRGPGNAEYEYCVYKDNELCLLGPFDKCSSNGKLNNSCPKNYNEIEPPPAGTEYQYCVYSSSEVCLTGPFDTCIGGVPGSTCPYESKITPPPPPSPSSSSGTGGGQSSSSNYGDLCPNYCKWEATGCEQIRTDPLGLDAGRPITTCADANTNCDYNGLGRYGSSGCTGADLGASTKPTSCTHKGYSPTYCQWDYACHEIKTDPAGLYGNPVSSCATALLDCARYGDYGDPDYPSSGYIFVDYICYYYVPYN